MENQNNAAMMKAINKITLLIMFLAFTLSTTATTIAQNDQYSFNNKRETMKNVLKALEEGRNYDSMPYWRENESGFSLSVFDIPDFDFEWNFPEFRFDEELIDDMEMRFKVMEKRMQERLEELEERLYSLSEYFSGKYRELI